MLLLTIDDIPRGSPGARLDNGEVLHFARAARQGTIEAWLPGSVMEILAAGAQGLAVAEAIVSRVEAISDPDRAALRNTGALMPTETRLLAPIPSPGMILAAGLAYRSHLAEMAGTPEPAHPTAFLKSSASVSGPAATVRLPPQAPDQVDYEGELAIVIGRECHDVDASQAMTCIAGYTVANDLSARNWVKAVWNAHQPWEARQTWEVNIMGKQLPGFTALGPVLATANRIGDPMTMRLTTRVNDEIVQDTPIADLIFPLGEVLAYFSRWYRFRPGDVLLTGTPAGVGVGRKPPLFLKDGDIVTVDIDRIGVLETHFRA